MISQKDNFVILGPSGGGKGTQADFISQKYGQIHLITGDVLNTIAKTGTEVGQKVKTRINNGQWVDDEIVNEAMAEAIDKIDSSRGIIFDGYPRTLEQAIYLDRILARLNRPVPIIINIQVDDKSVIYRLLNRKVCEKCGFLFHPPASLTAKDCHKCGGKLIRRPDDIEEIIKNRLSEFHQNSKAIIAYYKKNHRLINIDGEPTIPKVTAEINQKLAQNE